MTPTLAEILEMDVIREGLPELLAAPDRLDREIRWVHVSELSDIGTLLHGGELILTTGVGLPTQGSGLVRYIDDLAEAGVAGLVIELGRRFRSVPRPVVSRAEARGLPVIQLRREIRFVDVTLAVHSLIIESQTERLRRAAAIHETFTTLSVEGADPQQIIDEARRITEGDIVLENLSHQVVAHSSPRPAEELLADWGARSRGAAFTGDDLRDGDEETWLETFVQARGNRWGRLILLGAGGDLEMARTVLERCAQTLALNRLVQREDYTLAHHAQSSIFSDIRGGAFSSTSEVYSRARALGIDLGGRDLVGMTVLVESASLPVDTLNRERMRRAHAERISNVLADAGVPSLVGPLVEDRINLVLALEHGADVDEWLLGLAGSIHRAFTAATSARVTIGVGSVVQRMHEVRRSLLEAGQAADGATGSDRLFNRLTDVRVRGLTQLLREDLRLQTFVERELGDLIRHDQVNGTNLIAVLAAYLSVGGNKSHAAREAHLSRPAFYDRIRRIESITGAVLESAESRTSLHLAILALDAIEGAPRLTGGDGSFREW
jgi:PucR family transcriptional regulator, purine catabolism regulatory protein